MVSFHTYWFYSIFNSFFKSFLDMFTIINVLAAVRCGAVYVCVCGVCGACVVCSVCVCGVCPWCVSKILPRVVKCHHTEGSNRGRKE